MIAIRSIRAALPHDADTLAALAAHTEGAPHWPPYVYASMSTDPAKLVLVLEQGMDLAGYVVAALIPSLPVDVELEAIVVAADRQRQGHGRALLHAMLDWAAARGAARVLLEVRASNATAQRLYRTHGFAVTGRRPRYYQSPVEDAVLMERTADGDPARSATPNSVKIVRDYGS